MFSLSNLKFQVKKFFNPFNKLNLPIPNEYHEVDEMLFHSIKKIFIDYIELEKPFMSWEDDRHYTSERHTKISEMSKWIKHPEQILNREINEQTLELYIWIKITLPMLHDDLEQKFKTSWQAYHDELYNTDKGLYELETQKLMEIVSLRRNFWT